METYNGNGLGEEVGQGKVYLQATLPLDTDPVLRAEDRTRNLSLE